MEKLNRKGDSKDSKFRFTLGKKLIALFLAISLIPLFSVVLLSNNSMNDLGDYSETNSSEALEKQMENQLMNEAKAKQEEIENIVKAREVDARSLSHMGAIDNFLAADNGEMKSIRDLSQSQVGAMSMMMRSGVESAAETVAKDKYNVTSISELTEQQKTEMKGVVELLLGGTDGNGTTTQGTMYSSFQPGFIGDTGYAYIVNAETEIVMQHSLPDGLNLIVDLGPDYPKLANAFETITDQIENDPEVRNGKEWGIAEYLWQDTTQEGNPEELKFIAYTYYEPLEWIICPSVYYYELQTKALEDAKSQVETTFLNYLNNKKIDVGSETKEIYHKITFAGPEGQEVASATGDEITTDTSINHINATWFADTKGLDDGDINFGKVYKTESSELLNISSPVFYDGNFSGVISLSFKYSAITDLTNAVTIGESGYIYIVDDRGVTVSHPNPAVIDTYTIVDADKVGQALVDIVENDMLKSKTGISDYTYQGVHKWVAYAPIQVGDSEYSIAVTIPVKEATSAATQLGEDLNEKTDNSRNLMLLLAAGAGIAVALAGFFSARYFSNPIVTIKEEAENLANGNLSSDFDVKESGDEIGDMVRSFKVMKSNLKNSISQIKASMQGLANGNMNVNVDTSNLKGEYKEMGTSVNESMRAVQTSIDQIKGVMTQLADGNLDTEIETSDLQGDYKEMAVSVNQSIDAVEDSMDQIREVMKDLAEGELDTEIDSSAMEGDYKEMAEAVNESINAVNDSMHNIQKVMNSLASGELDTKIDSSTMQGDYKEMAEAINQSMMAVDESMKQIKEVMESLAQGDLNASITTASMEGDYKEMGQSVNKSMEAVQESIETIKNVMNSLAVGDLDVYIESENMEGDYREMAEAVSQSIDAIKYSMNQIKEVMNALAEGNLSKNVDTAQLDGEYSDIGEAVNSSIHTTRENINELRSASEEVDNAAESIAASSEELNSTAENVSGSVQNISEGTSRQARMSEDMSQQIEGAAANMEETSASAEDIAASSEEVAAQTDEGKEYARKASEMVDELQSRLDRTREKAFELDEQSDEIGEVIETISDIAEQTNLLALNAAIEAARAGEHGKGFAVVADSVRELAEETQEETENIKNIIEETQINASDVVEGVKDVTKKSNEVNEVTEKNLQSLEQIGEATDTVSTSIQDISSAVDEVAEELQDASEKIENVAQIADKNSSEAESSAAAAEEQTASVEELSSSAQQLSSLANNLSEIVRQYKTEG